MGDRYVDRRIAMSTLGRLAEAGLRLTLTPLGPLDDARTFDPLHATVELPLPPTDDGLERAAAAFREERDNPFPRRRWTLASAALRDISVLNRPEG